MIAGEIRRGPWDEILAGYHSMGFALMPVSDKVLTREVYNYCMTKRASLRRLQEWFRADTDAKLAARMGNPSDNIMCVKIVNADPFESLYKGLDLCETRTILSPDGNYALLYRFPRCYKGLFEISPTATLIGEGNLIYLPPSTTTLGYQYKYELKMPINPAPRDLVIFLSMCATKRWVQKAERHTHQVYDNAPDISFYE